MRRTLGLYRTSGVAIVGAALIVVTPIAPPAPDVQARAARLAGGDAPLGDGTALIVGASGIPTPGQGYIDYALSHYLAQLGFTGTAQDTTTPESLYPFSGAFSETINQSLAGGEQVLVKDVQDVIAGGGVSPENPVVMFGYSQGSFLLGHIQEALQAAGVPLDDVHMVEVGDTGNPHGLLEAFDLPNGTNPTLPALGLTFFEGQQSDLYPTDVYTLEYDGWADTPRYPLDVLTLLNAFLGMLITHLSYFGLSQQQIADAIPLPASADSVTDYYMIPQTLPLLDPVLLLPFVGQPLYDLLSPAVSILVNLGYGSVTDGWAPGDWDEQSTVGFLPPLSVILQALAALGPALAQGVANAAGDLVNPDNYVYSLPTWFNELLLSLPATSSIGTSAMSAQPVAGADPTTSVDPTGGDPTAGLDPTSLGPADTPPPLEPLGGLLDLLVLGFVSQGLGDVLDLLGVNYLTYYLTTGLQDVTNALESILPVYHTGVPQIDILETALFSLPIYDLNIILSDLITLEPIEGIGDALSADVGLSLLAAQSLISDPV
jgi:hypothetical protein